MVPSPLLDRPAIQSDPWPLPLPQVPPRLRLVALFTPRLPVVVVVFAAVDQCHDVIHLRCDGDSTLGLASYAYWLLVKDLLANAL